MINLERTRYRGSASAVVAATIESRFGIQGKAHGQKGTVRGYALDFRDNRAEGDDLLGDAYEYLMRHFATESGKSKGQFYTPAEVSRMMAKVIGAGMKSVHRLVIRYRIDPLIA